MGTEDSVPFLPFHRICIYSFNSSLFSPVVLCCLSSSHVLTHLPRLDVYHTGGSSHHVLPNL